MEPLQTHNAALPQQELTHPAGGCPSGLRPWDLVQGGHEGAKPHVGPQVADGVVDNATTGPFHPPEVSANELGDASASTSGSKSLSRLDIYKLLSGKYKTLPLTERVDTIIGNFGNDYQLSLSRDEITSTLPSILPK